MSGFDVSVSATFPLSLRKILLKSDIFTVKKELEKQLGP